MLCYVLSKMGGAIFPGIEQCWVLKTLYSGQEITYSWPMGESSDIVYFLCSGFWVFLMLTFGGGSCFSTEIKIEHLMWMIIRKKDPTRAQIVSVLLTCHLALQLQTD